MSYIENPKTRGSGIVCCIPHSEKCPIGCEDCYFQGGRSYLEPLEDNLPNMPSVEEVGERIVRVNDGHDSAINSEMVRGATKKYKRKFYNSSSPEVLTLFPNDPCVLTVNPASMTCEDFHKVGKGRDNLMFVRIRVCTWNSRVVKAAVSYYTEIGVPVILTFLAFYEGRLKIGHVIYYSFRKRTLNKYMAITSIAWKSVMEEWEWDPLVYNCGKSDGEKGTGGCVRCGNCLREYYNTMRRLRR